MTNRNEAQIEHDVLERLHDKLEFACIAASMQPDLVQAPEAQFYLLGVTDAAKIVALWVEDAAARAKKSETETPDGV